MDGGGAPQGKWRRLASWLAYSRLVHFVAIGAALYALVPREPGDADVVVSEDQVAQILRVEARKHSEPLDPEEKRRAVDAYVEQELLVREAVRLGIEREEPMVRERLAQAMIASVARAAADAPVSEAELRTFHAAHADQWHRAPEARFEYVFVPRAARDDAAAALAAANARKAELEGTGQGPRSSGAQEPAAPREAGPITASDVARILGQPVAEVVFAGQGSNGRAELPLARWSDPVASSYGYYLVRVRERIESREASFEAVRPQVEEALRAEHARGARQAFALELARRYRVHVTIPADTGLPPSYRFEPAPDPTSTTRSEVGP